MPRPAHTPAHTPARLVRATLAGVALLATAAHAVNAHASEAWEVSRLEGHVKVSRAGHWHTLEPGMDVAVGAWVKTGTRGRVTLERQGTTIEVKPRTQIAVAGRSLSPDKTVLMQRWGSTALDVDKRDEPHLEVHTPFLAAVVKGTVLDVNVGRTRSDIGVRSGEVTVRDDARGSAADIGSGQSAGAGQGSNGAMRVAAKRGMAKPVMRRGAPAPVMMAPIARSAPMTSETADMAPRKLMQTAVLRGGRDIAQRRRARASDSESGQSLRGALNDYRAGQPNGARASGPTLGSAVYLSGGTDDGGTKGAGQGTGGSPTIDPGSDDSTMGSDVTDGKADGGKAGGDTGGSTTGGGTGGQTASSGDETGGGSKSKPGNNRNKDKHEDKDKDED